VLSDLYLYDNICYLYYCIVRYFLFTILFSEPTAEGKDDDAIEELQQALERRDTIMSEIETENKKILTSVAQLVLLGTVNERMWGN